ncbi:unnamed protein product [Phytophthora fragariaefolia]|uniref:Unnamed protein product n=1 Tax=Phytophthora fragariaefolia TaxID=1490495 RepID=A0A9W6X196_9STRA|nr:unnamed protein product [Phytophthora fragariaefolia]
MGVAEVFGVPQEVTVDSVKVCAEAPLGVKRVSLERLHGQVGFHALFPCGVRKALIAWEAGDTASNEGNLLPHEPVKAKYEEKVGEDAYCVGNIVPHKASMVDDTWDEASSDVGNIVPRRGRRRRRRHRKSGLLSQTGVAQGDSEPKAKAPQTRSPVGHYHVMDSETGLRAKADAVQLEALPEVAELLNLEEISYDDFLAALKAVAIAKIVFLRPEPTPEELNSSSVMDEDVLEGFRKQSASRLGSEMLKNPKDLVYPLVKEFEDVVSNGPPSQLPPDRGIRREIDLVPGTKYSVTKQWPLPRDNTDAEWVWDRVGEAMLMLCVSGLTAVATRPANGDLTSEERQAPQREASGRELKPAPRHTADDRQLSGFNTRRHFNGDDAKLSQANDVAWGLQKTRGNMVLARDELEALFDVGSDADMEDGEEEDEGTSGSDRPLADAGPLSSPRSGGDSTSSNTVVSRTGPVRDPWMLTPSEIQSRIGSTAPPSQYALYSCSAMGAHAGRYVQRVRVAVLRQHGEGSDKARSKLDAPKSDTACLARICVASKTNEPTLNSLVFPLPLVDQ